ncbi:hypothetical protein BDC45DRAFT_441612 [Circinella umbellata]|nr:hypothetical protein BDC45DRAFT_441612 [Circinella umbellata]
MTYHLKPLERQTTQPTLIPDFVAYTEPYSDMNFDFMFLEVRKKGKQANVYKSDIIKLGKELKIAVDKLVSEGVNNPEVVGINVEGLEMTTYKLDLEHNGQYGMCKLNSCSLPREGANNVGLIPTCIKYMIQVEIS